MTSAKRTTKVKRRFFGCRVKQRNSKTVVPLFVFYAPVKDVSKWAGVRRVTDSPDGTQRVLREGRVKAITRFLRANSDNSIPNNILLAFEPKVARFKSMQEELAGVMPDDVTPDNQCADQVEWGILDFSFDPTLEEERRPIHIVDGQHRVHGMAGLDEEDVPALIVALLDATAQEQAFQFIVINNKAVRAPTENVKSIIAGINEEKLRERLLHAGVAYGEQSPVLRDLQTLPESPFKGILDWAYNKTGARIVPLTAIESSLRYIKSALAHIADDDDSVAQVFMAMWRGVQQVYPEIWGTANTPLMTKVSITALNEFMTDKLKAAWAFERVDIDDEADILRAMKSLLSSVPDVFWKENWSAKIQDNANVKLMIKTDLETIVINKRMKRLWYLDVRLLAAKDGTA